MSMMSCLVLDTNLWRQSALLRDTLSASLLYALRATGSVLGLPQVIEREVVKNGVEHGQKARSDVDRGLRVLRALTGAVPDALLPDDAALRSAVDRRIADLEPLLVRSPLTMDHVLRALDRVDLHEAPAHSGQQVKDCLIWEACLDLSAGHEVHLASQDKAFFKEGNHQKGMHPGLVADCDRRDVRIHLHSSLEAALAHFEPRAVEHFDDRRAVLALEPAVAPLVEDSLRLESAALGGERNDASVRPFVTERPDRLALDFTLGWDLLRDGAPVADQWAAATGSCVYDQDAADVTEVRLRRVEIRTGAPDDPTVIRTHAYGYINSSSGSQPVPHTIRQPLRGE